MIQYSGIRATTKVRPQLTGSRAGMYRGKGRGMRKWS